MASRPKESIRSIVINIPEPLMLQAVKLAQQRNIDTRAFVSEIAIKALQEL